MNNLPPCSCPFFSCIPAIFLVHVQLVRFSPPPPSKIGNYSFCSIRRQCRTYRIPAADGGGSLDGAAGAGGCAQGRPPQQQRLSHIHGHRQGPRRMEQQSQKEYHRPTALYPYRSADISYIVSLSLVNFFFSQIPHLLNSISAAHS
jgi:hypothetical protein